MLGFGALGCDSVLCLREACTNRYRSCSRGQRGEIDSCAAQAMFFKRALGLPHPNLLSEWSSRAGA